MEVLCGMKNIIFGVLSVIFFVIYFNVLIKIWNLWVPFNSTTDVISMFILISVIIPLSVISAQQAIKIIKRS